MDALPSTGVDGAIRDVEIGTASIVSWSFAQSPCGLLYLI
jgi:hypothetical protein